MTQNPARHLSEAADAIRAFNHDSFASTPGWEHPDHSYRALGSLVLLAGHLEQSVEQSVTPVMRTFEHGRLLVEHGGDPGRTINVVVAARQDALKAAGGLLDALRRMHTAVSTTGLDVSPEGDEDT